jgi:hypothetical protein
LNSLIAALGVHHVFREGRKSDLRGHIRSLHCNDDCEIKLFSRRRALVLLKRSGA